MNKVLILGNLGADPELKTFDNGSLCNLSIATTKKWTDNSTGEIKEHTEWHRVVMHGKSAEVANKYLTKGSKVLIEGELRTRSWEQNGEKKYTTEIVSRQMQMLGGGQQKTKPEPVEAEPMSNNNGGDGLPF